MKPYCNFKLSIIYVFGLLLLSSCSQNIEDYESPVEDLTPGPAGNDFVHVVLLVDTDNIVAGSEENFCVFANQATNISDKDFLTKVIRSNSVEWLAYSYSSPNKHIVNITAIKGNDLDDILEANNTPEANGKFKRLVKASAPRRTRDYKLHFEVIRDGDTLRNLVIDPKLKVIR